MTKLLMKGNEAIAEAAIQAGCRFFYGYPITPQNEIPEYMARRMPQVNGVFLQAESEVSAINMVYGTAGVGERVMTSSSSPGISLKQEGISYLIGAQLPCVIVNIVRGGPGLGSIQPSQCDYFQSTRGGGHGDYRMVVYAPDSVQESIDLTQRAFDVADKYRNPTLILGDGVIGQMMEPVVMPDYKLPDNLPAKDWAATGWSGGRERAVLNSLYLDPILLEKHNLRLKEKYDAMERDELLYDTHMIEDAEIILVAYGTSARIALAAAKRAREQGVKAGVIRPITVWPFPFQAIAEAAKTAKAFLAVEMSMGQLVEDVRLAVCGARPVSHFGRMGGIVHSVKETAERIVALKEAM